MVLIGGRREREKDGDKEPECESQIQGEHNMKTVTKMAGVDSAGAVSLVTRLGVHIPFTQARSMTGSILFVVDRSEQRDVETLASRKRCKRSSRFQSKINTRQYCICRFEHYWLLSQARKVPGTVPV